MKVLLCLLALTLLIGCSALAPTRNPDGSQTASPTGKTVLVAADTTKTGLDTLTTAPGLVGVIASIAAILTGVGVNQLHKKFDDQPAPPKAP